jgi:hypothetical protein
VTFFNTFTNYDTEPLLQVARMQCREGGSPDQWDLWNVFYKHIDRRELGAILNYSNADEGRIIDARLIAVPLFSISRIQEVTALVDRVITAWPNASEAVSHRQSAES